MQYFWLWIGIFVVTVVIEVLTAGALVSVWFSVAALLALVAERLGFGFGVQLAVFIISSIVFVGYVMPIVKRNLETSKEATNADRYIGMERTLRKGVGSERDGEIKINDVTWLCTSEDRIPIDEGALVEIIGFEGSKAIVRKKV